MRRKNSFHIAATALLALSLSLPPWMPATAQPVGIPSLGGGASAADLAPVTERKLGDLIVREGRRDPSFIHDIEMTQYLNDLAQRLARQTQGASHIELFPVLDPQFNAFALPGGYIGIHTGVMAISDDESQLAGIMAHEIAHVTQRHVARGLTQQQKTNAIMLASIAGALLAAFTGGANLAAGVAAFGQAAAIDQHLGFSREAEKEADRMGLQMLTRAGFKPTGLQEMFAKLMQTSNLNQGMRGGNTYMSTHPLSIDRLSDLENRTRLQGQSNYQDSAAYAYMRARAQVIQARSREAKQRLRDRLVDEATRSSGIRRSAAYLGLSELAGEQGQFDQARNYLSRASEGMSDSPYLARQRAWLALRSGNAQEAARLAGDALGRWPDQAALYEVQARALDQLGQPARAAQVLEQAIKRWPQQYPDLYELRAKALIRADKKIQGREAMAQYYLMTGAFAGAIAQLEQAQALTNDYREQSVLDVRIREVRQMMEEERELLRRFGR